MAASTSYDGSGGELFRRRRGSSGGSGSSNDRPAAWPSRCRTRARGGFDGLQRKATHLPGNSALTRARNLCPFMRRLPYARGPRERRQRRRPRKHAPHHSRPRQLREDHARPHPALARGRARRRRIHTHGRNRSRSRAANRPTLGGARATVATIEATPHIESAEPAARDQCEWCRQPDRTTSARPATTALSARVGRARSGCRRDRRAGFASRGRGTPTRRPRKQRSSGPPRFLSQWTSPRWVALPSSAIRKAPRSGPPNPSQLHRSRRPAIAE